MKNYNYVFLISIVALIAGFILGWNGGVNSIKNSMSHSSMDAMAGMTTGLEGKMGDAFDKAFIEGMIGHHQNAVEMAQQALTYAQHEEIKTMAHAIITAQTKEINDLKEWNILWFKQ